MVVSIQDEDKITMEDKRHKIMDVNEEKKGKRTDNGLIKNNKGNWFKRNWKYIVGFILTIGLMIYLIISSNPVEIRDSLIQSNGYLILAALGGTILLFVIKILRWKAILKQQGYKVKFFQAFKLILIGTFGSAITPAKVGDILRAFYLSKDKKEVKIGISVFSVVFDRILDLTGIFLIVGFFAPFILLDLEIVDWKIPIGIVAGFILFILIVVFVFSEKVTKPILNFIIKHISKIFKKKEAQDKIDITSTEIIDDFYLGQKNYNLKNYFWLGFLSIVFWILLGLQGCLLLEAFNVVEINCFIVITTLCLAAIVALTIPTSVSGIGIRDFVIIYVLGLLMNTSEAQALSLSIIQTFLNVLLPALIGGILLFMYRKSKERKPKRVLAIPN